MKILFALALVALAGCGEAARRRETEARMLHTQEVRKLDHAIDEQRAIEMYRRPSHLYPVEVSTDTRVAPRQ